MFGWTWNGELWRISVPASDLAWTIHQRRTSRDNIRRWTMHYDHRYQDSVVGLLHLSVGVE